MTELYCITRQPELMGAKACIRNRLEACAKHLVAAVPQSTLIPLEHV